LSFETTGINRLPATTASFPATSLLLGNHLLLGRVGCVIHIPCHLLFVPARVNNFLLSGRFDVEAAKGMGKVCRTKRFELIRRTMLFLMKYKGIIRHYGGKGTYQRAAAILKHSHAKLQRLLPRRLHQRTDALLDHFRV
jgi:hypothetical protein